jgi:DNA-binding CsgD family transcriptional regulator
MVQKKNKSDSYQHKIIEITVDPSVLNDFAMDDGLGFSLNTSKFSEEFYELRIQLIQEVLRVVKSCLTKRQEEVITLRLKDLTQIQIAEKLGIHQTTVHKLLMGNIDYANGKKRYGGAIKKLKKICAKDDKIVEILEEMERLRAKDSFEENIWILDDEEG